MTHPAIKHLAIGLIWFAGLMVGHCNCQNMLEKDHAESATAYQDTIQTLRQQLDAAEWYLDTNAAICLQLCAELEGWRDHGRRMRIILKIPDTLEMSYAIKCAYSIDTRRLVGSNAIYLKPEP